MPGESIVDAHFKLGFTESQKVIQFQDVKSSSVMGAALLVLGTTFAFSKWILESSVKEDEVAFAALCRHISPYSGWIITLFSLLVVSAIACLWYCFSCVNPRPPKSISRKFAPNVLFPIYNPSESGELWKLKTHCEKFFAQDGDAAPPVHDDYVHQVEQLGKILYIKIRSVKIAIRCLFAEVILGIIASIVSVCLAIGIATP